MPAYFNHKLFTTVAATVLPIVNLIIVFTANEDILFYSLLDKSFEWLTKVLSLSL
jgi:hypothetical protein